MDKYSHAKELDRAYRFAIGEALPGMCPDDRHSLRFCEAELDRESFCQPCRTNDGIHGSARVYELHFFGWM